LLALLHRFGIIFLFDVLLVLEDNLGTQPTIGVFALLKTLGLTVRNAEVAHLRSQSGMEEPALHAPLILITMLNPKHAQLAPKDSLMFQPTVHVRYYDENGVYFSIYGVLLVLS
jgi:hypothetical protein